MGNCSSKLATMRLPEKLEPHMITWTEILNDEGLCKAYEKAWEIQDKEMTELFAHLETTGSKRIVCAVLNAYRVGMWRPFILTRRDNVVGLAVSSAKTFDRRWFVNRQAQFCFEGNGIWFNPAPRRVQESYHYHKHLRKTFFAISREICVTTDPGLISFSPRCEACGKKHTRMRTCSECHQVHYCSQDCQRDHWPTHKVLCHWIHQWFH